MRAFLSFVSALAALQPMVAAQLSGSVGPTTTRDEKTTKGVFNIMDYGGVASATTDNSAAIASAWAAADSNGGGQVYIPEGDYGLESWLTLKGDGISINLEGIVYRTGTDDGNMFMIENSSDFEFYSATSAGAIQGYGYTFHADGEYGPRIMRLQKVNDFSVHDIALVDSPAFHLTMDTCTNGEVYNMIIRGGNEGGLDGVDIWGSNIWVHDVEVTNKDECVTVKSPANNILVESIFCNWSGGCAIGSLAADTAISNIEYNHIYTQNSNQMFMIKSNGGSGSLTDSSFNNFMGHSNAYTLDLDSAWSSQSVADGDGVEYSNLTFSNWHGTCSNGAQRAPIRMICPAAVPCTDMTIDSFYVWTESGSSEIYVNQNAYGSGPALNTGSSHTTFTTTATVSTVTGATYTTMPAELTTGFALTASIPIPTIPTTFYPGLTPTSALLG